jgi:hypothetical protein
MEHQLRIFNAPRIGRKGYSAFFALELDSMFPVPEIDRKELRARNSALVRALYRPELDTALEIRAVRWSDRGPALALRVRVSDSDCVNAAVKAKPLHELLCAELEALFPHLAWRPVLTEERYRQLFDTPRGALVCDIGRKTAIHRVKCERSEVPEIIPALNERGMLAEVELWAPNRLIFQSAPWDTALALLAATPGAAVISAVLAPVRTEEREKKFLLAQGLAADSATSLDCLSTVPNGAKHVRKASRQMASEFSEAAYLFSLRVAAQAKGLEFAEAVGASFCATAGFSTPWDADEALASGGFEATTYHPQDQAGAAADLGNASLSWRPGHGSSARRRLSLMAAVGELAGLVNLPGAGTGRCPAVASTSSKTAPVTGGFAHSGVLLGTARSSGGDTPVILSREDLSRHAYLLGATGSGKTTAMRNLLVQIINSGSGCLVMDFHGDLAASLPAAISPSRLKDIISIDLSDSSSDFRLNILEHEGPVERDLAINALMEMFARLFVAESMGPLFELVMRTSLMTLMSEPGATLTSLPRVFIDRDYRHALIGKCPATTPQLAEAWGYIERTTGEHSLSAMLPYVLSKINMFTHSSVVRPIISARKSSVDFEAAIREKKVILLSLAKGRVGKMNASFVAMLLAEKLLRAAMKRGPAGAASPFYVCVDEFQNVAVPSFAEMVTETRKFGVSLILANQYVSQTPKAINTAIMNNAGTIACFRAGAEDAALLEPYFAPAFNASDLLNLPVGKACAAVTAGGKRLEPFSLFIAPPAGAGPHTAPPYRSAACPGADEPRQFSGGSREKTYTVRLRRPRDGEAKGNAPV